MTLKGLGEPPQPLHRQLPLSELKVADLLVGSLRTLSERLEGQSLCLAEAPDVVRDESRGHSSIIPHGGANASTRKLRTHGDASSSVV